MDKELERQFLMDIEPLINEYQREEELPPETIDENEIGHNAEKEDGAVNGRSIKEEILRQLEEEKDPENRKDLIEQLKELRNIQKQDIQKEILNKAKEFIDKTKEDLDQKIENRKKQIQEIKTRMGVDKAEEENANFKEMLKHSIVGSKEDIAIRTKQKENLKVIAQYQKDVGHLQSELESFEADKVGFENIAADEYDVMSLVDFVLVEQLEDRFKQIEKGYEDLLSDEYKERKQEILEGNSKKEDLESLNEISLLEIYKEKLDNLGQDDPERKELQKLIQKVENREKEIREKQTNQRDQTQKPGQKPEQKPEQKPGQKPEQKPEQKPGQKPAQKPEQKPAQKPTTENRKKIPTLKDVKITVDLKNDEIYIEVAEEKEPIIIQGIKDARKAGKLRIAAEYKEQDENGNSPKKTKEARLMDPAILSALHNNLGRRISHEYMFNFTAKDNEKINNVTYIFPEKEEINDKETRQMVRQTTRYAKKAENYEVAQVNGINKGIIERMKEAIERRSIKRLENKRSKTIEEKEETRQEARRRKKREKAVKKAERKTQRKNSKMEKQPEITPRNFQEELQQGAPTQEEQNKTAKEFVAQETREVKHREPLIRRRE